MAQGIDINPSAADYSPLIIYSAYVTAFIMTGFLGVLYYHTQHLVPGKSTSSRIFFVTIILFAVKGEPIRQPIMNVLLNYEIGLKNPLGFVFLQQIDKWAAIFLLAVCLVYLCPKKLTSNKES